MQAQPEAARRGDRVDRETQGDVGRPARPARLVRQAIEGATQMTKMPTEVLLTKDIDAPRELVFEAFTRAEHDEKRIAPAPFTSRDAGTTLTVRQVFPRWEALTAAQQELMRPRIGGAKEGWTQSLRHLGDYLKR